MGQWLRPLSLFLRVVFLPTGLSDGMPVLHIHKLILFLPLYVILGIVGYMDHCHYRIPNASLVMILTYACIVGLCGQDIYPLSALLLTLLVSGIPAVMTLLLHRPIFFGWGDVKLMGVCGLFLPPEHLGFFLILSGLFAIVHRWIFRKDLIPFAPAIALAFVSITL